MIEKCRPWWKKSKNGFSATPSGRMLMLYTLKERKLHCDSGDVCIMRSNEVKCWSKPPNQGQIGQISGNIPNIHMFRLGILSRIQIQDSLRSNQVIKRSNLGQTWVRAVKLGSNRVDKSKFNQYTYSSTPNFVQNTNSKFFEVK